MIEDKQIPKKKAEWSIPEIFSLSIKKTEGGGNPAITEDSFTAPSGGS